VAKIKAPTRPSPLCCEDPPTTTCINHTFPPGWVTGRTHRAPAARRGAKDHDGTRAVSCTARKDLVLSKSKQVRPSEKLFEEQACGRFNWQACAFEVPLPQSDPSMTIRQSYLKNQKLQFKHRATPVAAALSSAFAADLSYKAPPPPAPVPPSWTGFYVGAHIGAAWQDLSCGDRGPERLSCIG
jgi:hypothetical protein